MTSTPSLRPVLITDLHIGGIASVRVMNAPEFGLIEHYIVSAGELVDILANKLPSIGEMLMYSVSGEHVNCMRFGFVPEEVIIVKNDTPAVYWLNEVYVVKIANTLHLSELVYGEDHLHHYRLIDGVLLPAESRSDASPEVVGRVVASIILPAPFPN